MKKALSNILLDIQPSITMGVTQKAAAMRQAGQEVYSLGAGEPDFFVHDSVKQACVEAVLGNYSKYNAVEGLPRLREAIAEKLARENGIDAKPEEVIVSSGAKHALYTAIQALCSPGEEILIPVPAWVSYIEMAKFAGAVPVSCLTRKENGFKITPDELKAAINANTKALMLNSPSNPTGAVYTEPELRALAEICLEEGIYIISDEIYEKFLYDGATHSSVASFGEEIREITLTINGFSKTYAMPGWRVGYTHANTEVVHAMSTIQGHCVSHPSLVSQYAAAEALSLPESYIEGVLAEYSQRRSLVEGFLQERGIWHPPTLGAFYFFCDVSAYLGGKYPGAKEFCEALLTEKQVVAIPGSFFGMEGFIRLSYAASREVIAAALERIGSFLEETEKYVEV